MVRNDAPIPEPQPGSPPETEGSFVCPDCGTTDDTKHNPHLDRTVVATWSGDESRFISGVPNRDVTVADGIDPDLLAEAYAAGTHTPKE